jgi:hypothetical protein
MIALSPPHLMDEARSAAARPIASEKTQDDVSPERIAELAHSLANLMAVTIGEISEINGRGRLLSLNARIEASRVNDKLGAAFSVVAQEMQELSNTTGQVTQNLSTGAKSAINELERISEALATNVRGLRLSDLASVNIDLIDRCLYERSCDVRWWATDSSLVNALTNGTPAACEYASQRLGVILDAYTVYLDLVLCDCRGNVVANGRPNQFDSRGKNVESSPWFRAAIDTASGNEFGFQTAHHSSLVKNNRALVYSCSVRESGDATGKIIGVLGIVFNWDGLAQIIVHNTPLSSEEKDSTRVVIVDDDGLLLADSNDRQLQETLPRGTFSSLFLAKKKAFSVLDLDGQNHRVGYAYSPGFETYSTGWHSLLLQRL